MKISFSNMKRFSAAVMASACAFASCVQMEEQGDAVGYLVAPLLEVDAVVEDLTQTKALDFVVEEPELSEIYFVVKDKDGNTRYDAVGLWTEPLVLPVGAYTIDAYYGENGFGAPYFTGSASGSIDALDREVPHLTIALANSLVNVSVSDALAEHFKGDKIGLNGGAYEASYGEWFYVPSGADLSLELAGTNSAGNPASLLYTLAAPAPKVAYRITCGTETTDWPSVSLSLDDADVWASRIYITTPASFTGNISAANQAAVVYEAIPSSSSDWTAPSTAVSESGVLVIKGLTPGTEYQVRARVGALVSPVVKVIPEVDGLSVTAGHTFSSGELDGTDVISAFAKSDAVKEAIDSWTVRICRADGTVLRSEASPGTSDGSAITTGWPYLPVGSYKVVARVTMKDGEVIDNIVSNAFSTESPSFTVAASAYTSYNKYLLSDLDFANDAANKHTVFERRASVSISDNILSNANYADIRSSSIIFNSTVLGDFDSNSKDFGNDTGCTEWKNYPFKATMTFDGVTQEASVDCHITGLPYAAAPPRNTGDHPWTEDATVSGSYEYNWGNDHVWFADETSSGAACLKIGSPEFNVPDNSIKVNISVSARGRNVLINYNVDTRVYVSPDEYFDFTANYNSGNFKEYSNSSLSLNSSFKKIQIENREHTALNRLHVNGVSITYR